MNLSQDCLSDILYARGVFSYSAKLSIVDRKIRAPGDNGFHKGIVHSIIQRWMSTGCCSLMGWTIKDGSVQGAVP